MRYKCCECEAVFDEEDAGTIRESRGEFWGSPCYETLRGRRMNEDEPMIYLVKPQGSGPMLAIQANSLEEYQAMMAECRKDYPTVKFSTPEVMTPSEYKRRYK